jgi:hypothetical protein
MTERSVVVLPTPLLEPVVVLVEHPLGLDDVQVIYSRIRSFTYSSP